MAFNAREWSKRSGEFCEYQTQHRKFGDDVVAIAPSSMLLDKQFRLLSHECVCLRNLYQVKIGIWKAPRKIVWQSYENCPPAVGEEPIASGSIKIDAKGLAKCYRTQDGVGVVGAQADKGKEVKGVSIWWWAAIVPVVGLVAWLRLRSMTSRGLNAMAGKEPNVASTQNFSKSSTGGVS